MLLLNPQLAVTDTTYSIRALSSRNAALAFNIFVSWNDPVMLLLATRRADWQPTVASSVRHTGPIHRSHEDLSSIQSPAMRFNPPLLPVSIWTNLVPAYCRLSLHCVMRVKGLGASSSAAPVTFVFVFSEDDFADSVSHDASYMCLLARHAQRWRRMNTTHGGTQATAFASPVYCFPSPPLTEERPGETMQISPTPRSKTQLGGWIGEGWRSVSVRRTAGPELFRSYTRRRC